jgi:hypothetical protein
MVDIKPGTYRLTRDVINPHPDRRMRRDWRALPVVPAGTMFAVSLWCPGTDNETVELKAHSSVGHDWSIGPSNDLFDLIAPFLYPVEESPTDYLLRETYEHHAGRLLDILVTQGKLTLADVVEALEAYKAE